MPAQASAVNKLREEFHSQITQSGAYRRGVLCVLHAYQTGDEQANKITQDLNGIGFTAPDAPVLSPLAEKVQAGERLDAAEEQTLCSRLPKYWGQFVRLIDPLDIDLPDAALDGQREAA